LKAGERGLFASSFHAGFLLGFFSDPEDGVYIFFPKCRLTFNELHGVIFQQIELSIIIAVITSNPTKWA
jgi:hypothetical protein